MYSGTKLVDALARQHEKRSNSELFKSSEFILDWRSKVGSFPHPDGETIVSAGEPCGSWRTVTLTKREKDSNGKWQDKKYFRHSRFFGSLKEKTAAEMKNEDSTFIIHEAVRGMLPTNKLSRHVISKLKSYPGAEHPHGAQRPEAYTIASKK